MDKETEKQFMLTAIMKDFNNLPPLSLPKICEALVKQGYGNLAQAVKEFAIELKKKFNAKRLELQKLSYDTMPDKMVNLGAIGGLLAGIDLIDELLKTYIEEGK